MTEYNRKTCVNGYHHAAIKAFDFDASVKFYTEGLGFKKDISWGEGDNRAIMLDTGNGNFLELFAGGVRGEKPEGNIIHLAFRTDDCRLALEKAKAAGAEVTMEAADIDIQSEPVTKVRIAFCKGPDGEVLEFFQYR